MSGVCGQDVNWSRLNVPGRVFPEKKCLDKQTRPNNCTGFPVVRAWAATATQSMLHAMQVHIVMTIKKQISQASSDLHSLRLAILPISAPRSPVTSVGATPASAQPRRHKHNALAAAAANHGEAIPSPSHSSHCHPAPCSSPHGRLSVHRKCHLG